METSHRNDFVTKSLQYDTMHSIRNCSARVYAPICVENLPKWRRKRLASTKSFVHIASANPKGREDHFAYNCDNCNCGNYSYCYRNNWDCSLKNIGLLRPHKYNVLSRQQRHFLRVNPTWPKLIWRLNSQLLPPKKRYVQGKIYTSLDNNHPLIQI